MDLLKLNFLTYYICLFGLYDGALYHILLFWEYIIIKFLFLISFLRHVRIAQKSPYSVNKGIAQNYFVNKLILWYGLSVYIYNSNNDLIPIQVSQRDWVRTNLDNWHYVPGTKKETLLKM